MNDTGMLDPELVSILSALPEKALRARFDDPSSIAAMRDTRALLGAIGARLPTRDGVTAETVSFDGPAGALPIRVYRPSGPAAGVLVFFHGGGYVIGDVYSEEERCLRLADKGACVVVSVGYSLAPEHRYPAALDDAVAAVGWVAGHAGEFGPAGPRLAVGGSSAGAGLAAATALALRDRGGPPLDLQLLVYPMLDDTLDSPSQRSSDTMALLTRRALQDAWDHYLGGQSADEYAAPARAVDLAGLPPAFVLLADEDPLRDEGMAYAARLAQCGVPTELHLLPGTFHGFDIVGIRTDVGRRAVALQCDALHRAMTGGSDAPGPVPSAATEPG